MRRRLRRSCAASSSSVPTWSSTTTTSARTSSTLIATRVPLTAELLGSCDAVVLVTDHDDVDYDLVTRHADYVFDARNRMRGEQVELL